MTHSKNESPPAKSPTLNLYHPVVFLLGVLALAFLIRLIGIGFGLPFNYHADEALEINQTLGFGSGDLNPHFFKLPPLVTYLLFPFYVLFYLAGLAFGYFSGPDAFLVFYLKDPTVFYLIARVIFGVLVGTASVGLLYFLARRFVSERTAAIASFWLAVNFLHVRDSHYFYLDIPLIAILLGGMWLCLLVLEKGSLKHYFWAGAFVGLAAAMKYNGVWLGVPLVLSHLFRGGSPKEIFFSGRLWVSLLTVPIVFFLLNPFALGDWNFFIKEGLEQLDVEGSSSWTHHLVYSLVNGLGWTLIGLSTVGILLAFVFRHKPLVILSFWIVSYYLLLVRGSQPHDRYVLPLIPFMLITAAWMIERLKIKSVPILTVLVFILAVPSIAKSVWADYLFLEKDTRTACLEFLETNLPPRSRLAIGEPYFYAPRVSRSREQLEEIISSIKSEGVKQKRYEKMIQLAPRGGFFVFFLNGAPDNETSYFSSRPQISYDLGAMRKLDVRYVVLPRLRASLPVDPSSIKFLRRFSPYRDSSLDSAIEPDIRTAMPGSWRELLARRSMGEIIDVYEIP